MILQRTIQSEVSTVGVGLHTGEKVKITLCPAPEGHGVVFQRDDITGQPKITVNPQVVTETKLCLCYNLWIYSNFRLTCNVISLKNNPVSLRCWAKCYFNLLTSMQTNSNSTYLTLNCSL